MNTARAAGLVLGAALLFEPALALALKPSVAIAPIRGRKRAQPKKLERGIRFGLKSVGARAIGAKTVKKVARRADLEPDSSDAAEAVGAGYIVVIKLKRQRKRTVAKAELVRAEDGRVVKKAVRRYRSAKGALKSGKAIGKLFGKVAKKLNKKKGAVAQIDEPEAPPPAPPRKVATAVPKDEDPLAPGRPSGGTKRSGSSTKAKAELGPKKKSRNPEDNVFRLSVGAGTQVGSAYTVAVGGEVTGLAYDLNPLFLLSGDIDLFFGGIGPGGLGINANVSFVPVKYQIDVDPPVDPAEPTGRFLNIGGSIRYRWDVVQFGESGRFYVAPLLGVAYHLLSVQDQGENTVVVSWASVNVTGGAQLGVQISEFFTLALEGRVGGVASYNEAPTTTGNSGKGLNTLLGGQARFWISDYLGIYLNGIYEFQRVGLSGEGNRTPFVEDPPLNDATVFSADFKFGTGVMLSL